MSERSSATIVLCDECSSGVPDYHDCDADFILDQLRSYNSPSETETRQLLLDIDYSESAINRYSEEITKLQKCIEALQTQKARATRAKEIRQALLAPINRLPIEILEDIFALVCCGEDTTWYSEDCPFFVFPFTLDIAHTCTAWRNLALSKGELWSSIDLLFHPDHIPCDPTKPLKLLASYLSYSKSAPLTISVRAYPGQVTQTDSELFYHMVKRILGVLLQYAKRWKSVDLTLDTKLFSHLKSPAGFIDSLAGGVSVPLSLPLLDSLTLDWENTLDDDLSDNWSSFGNVFINAVIHQLSIPYYNPKAHLFLPFSRLTTLHIREADQSNLLLALRTCPLLERLHVQKCQMLRLHSDNSPASADSVVACCPKLISLRPEVSAPEREESGSLDLLSYLEVPTLQELTVHQNTKLGKFFWSKDAFRSMISRSSCRLYTISVYGIVFSLDDIQDLILLSPTLRRLDLQESFHGTNESLIPPILRALTLPTADIVEGQTPSSDSPIKQRDSESLAHLPELEYVHLSSPLLGVYSDHTHLIDMVYTMLKSRTCVNGSQTIPSALQPSSASAVGMTIKKPFFKDFELWYSHLDELKTDGNRRLLVDYKYGRK
ncbi:hypothetical protein K435DRAFT_844729 [Dendrothele bispora CBS 962.96]|uniref:F-box domain-containing protein n=1 Tax=Dendrothele bispora (strain CBS 962.96) TaxID=1314807 RepID=A0A4S8L0M2_DENBC|nr:hypothetical protein K435DRAFT_844729 [Dendrothele bispora CBS 962.96]